MPAVYVNFDTLQQGIDDIGTALTSWSQLLADADQYLKNTLGGSWSGEDATAHTDTQNHWINACGNTHDIMSDLRTALIAAHANYLNASHTIRRRYGR